MAKLVVESVKLDGNELLWNRYTEQMDETSKKRTRTTTYIKAPKKSRGSEDRLRSPQKKKKRPDEPTQAQSDHATAKEGAVKEADQALLAKITRIRFYYGMGLSRRRELLTPRKGTSCCTGSSYMLQLCVTFVLDAALHTRSI